MRQRRIIWRSWELRTKVIPVLDCSVLLVANSVLNQGLEDEGTSYPSWLSPMKDVINQCHRLAIRAVERMANAPDFDRRMLLLATKLAHESDMSVLLLSVLEALIAALGGQNALHSIVEAITLCRCCIRLVLKLIDEQQSHR
jgi:hypothetical protein